MTGMYDPRRPRSAPTDGGAQKRSAMIKLGVLGAGLFGVYSVMSRPNCVVPPRADSPEALAMQPVDYKTMVDEYEQCRRRRSASSSSSRSRSTRSSLFGSSGSKQSASRGGFGRSGSFGG